VARWCTSVSDLYSNLSKPVLDTIIYNYELTKRVGGEGVGVAILTAQVGSFVLRALAPQFGKMVAQEAGLEGDFRFLHTRVIENAEEIALYHGEGIERAQLDASFGVLKSHVEVGMRAKAWYGIVEDFVIKYFWYYLCSSNQQGVEWVMSCVLHQLSLILVVLEVRI
jgi:ATP-binding cassette subfamily D (ALD) long-chain fatty acid import protein